MGNIKKIDELRAAAAATKCLRASMMVRVKICNGPSCSMEGPARSFVREAPPPPPPRNSNNHGDAPEMMACDTADTDADADEAQTSAALSSRSVTKRKHVVRETTIVISAGVRTSLEEADKVTSRQQRTGT